MPIVKIATVFSGFIDVIMTLIQFLTLTETDATAERSFSKLKLIKN